MKYQSQRPQIGGRMINYHRWTEIARHWTLQRKMKKTTAVNYKRMKSVFPKCCNVFRVLCRKRKKRSLILLMVTVLSGGEGISLWSRFINPLEGAFWWCGCFIWDAELPRKAATRSRLPASRGMFSCSRVEIYCKQHLFSFTRESSAG